MIFIRLYNTRAMQHISVARVESVAEIVGEPCWHAAKVMRQGEPISSDVRRIVCCVEAGQTLPRDLWGAVENSLFAECNGSLFDMAYRCIKHGHDAMLEWIVHYCRAILPANMAHLFDYGCTIGNLRAVKYLHATFGDYCFSDDTQLMKSSLIIPESSVAQWLTQFVDTQYMFEQAFIDDDVQFAIKLWQHTDAVNIGQAFRLLCVETILSLVAEFYNTFGSGDADMNLLFTDVCRHGNLDTAQWLLETFPDIDPRHNNNEAQNHAIARNDNAMSNWLDQI